MTGQVPDARWPPPARRSSASHRGLIALALVALVGAGFWEHRGRSTGERDQRAGPIERFAEGERRPGTRRSSAWRVRLITVFLVVLVLAGTAVAFMVFIGHGAGDAAASVSSQPRPTATPTAPAVVIARSPGTDLAGGWLVPQGGQYFLFVSTAFGNPRDNIPLLVGRPGQWSAPIDALPILPAWAVPVGQGGTTWQPEVFRLGGRYVLYFSAVVRGSQPAEHCIGAAVSLTIVGPYFPSPQPLVCQQWFGGDIDGQVVAGTTSANSHLYLVWKTDNNAVPGDGVDGIWSQPLSAGGLALNGSPTLIFSAWEAPPWARPIVEAPQLVMSPDGGWWLFYSGGGGFGRPNYAIGVARCRSVTGPCVAAAAEPLILSNDQGVGPGEETFFRNDGSDWLIYSPWHNGIPFAWIRPLVAARIGWLASGPYVAEAGSFPSP